MSVLYITHDLATAYYVSDRIAIMFRGNIVEMGTVEQVLMNPRHPYTRLLREFDPRGRPAQTLDRHRHAGRIGTRRISAQGLQVCRALPAGDGYLQDPGPAQLHRRRRAGQVPQV